MTKHSGHTVSIVVIFAVLLILTPPLMAATVNIDLNSTNQTIRGFGAATPWYLPAATESEIESAFGMDDGEIGLTILRLTVEPESSNWSKWVSSAQQAYEMGAEIIASPWHAPTEMRETIGDDYRLRYDMYDEYAAHLNSFVTYMANNDAPIYGLSIQNEPDIGDWTQWTPTEILTFMRDYAQAITGTNVMAPESYHFDWSYSDPILNDTTACANTDIICGHIYGSGLTKYPLAEEKGKEVWMTEYLMGENNSGNNWPWAMALAKNINDVMQADMNAYVWWTMVRYYGPIGDGTTAQNPQDPDESYPAKGEVTKKGYVMSQYSKFVRPGYVRVDATENPSPGVYVTAYAGSGNLVIVAINENSYSSDVTLSVSGGTVSSYTKYQTTNDSNVADMGSIGSTDTLVASSINTFVGAIDGGDTTPPTPDPMEWAVGGEPNATGPSSITMTAETATDDNPPVKYYFECTTDGDANSGWQTSPTYIAQELNPSTQYTFRVKARDSSFNQNETDFSGTASATTHDSQGIEILGSWVTGTTHAEETGSDRALIFIAHGESTESMNLSTVTYGGQSMEKVVDYSYNAADGWAYAAAFILDEAGISAASTSTFNPTWGGTAPGSSGYASVFLANVDQTDSTGATDTGGSTSNPVTTSPLSTEEGDMVILAATCGQAGSYILNNGFIEGTDQQMGGTVTGVTGHKLATGADETPSATYSSYINRQMIIGFVVQAPPFSGYQTCAEVQAGGDGLISDLTGDCYVNYADLEIIAYYWLDTDCGGVDDCEGADFEPDGDVDFIDFSEFGLQWMQCNNPEDPGCTPNW